ncbi:MAG: trypsin-like peptidase domain-containing protein [Williamsia herbipolensis]|uniref:Serine protease, S1-C subfamily, contains C-terminal PDZ domain n=1 Tax=Williamsia serinedens TaxID=391736 RepID=A0ABT1H890_9NOCA|nr:trypsin-like peptidase domain-containing protein [Williamsia serinedens]MBE7159908.1 trypsin-like peptidase domain-containing protein [Williamsia herbipolensis]MCP2162942.1 serine protease, S1-C subfamily, contains C-terminal PDZ domain [Williamsia serinedens]
MTDTDRRGANDHPVAGPASGPTRPAPDPATAAVFGRPDGVDGSFAAPEQQRARPRQPVTAPPDPVLREAFSRPDDATDTIGRDPDARYGAPTDEADPPDPWRDPGSIAALSTPAVSVPETPAPTIPGHRLGVRELLFDRLVSRQALVVLAVLALAVGALGGLVGRYTAEVVPPLHSDTVSLRQTDSSPESRQGRVADVAAAVENAVVAITVRTSGAVGTGSGVVLDKQGYIVTNNHVISLAATQRGSVEVTFSDRQRVPARIVGRDTKTDLAVVKVDGVDNLTVAALGDSSDLRIGQEVVAFGSPLGLDRTVTSGIVSATGRAVPLRPDETSDTDAVIDAIQTDAAINPGNSGGPLVDDDAKVIGINTARADSGGGSFGLGFAIPIDEAREVAQELIRDGRATHAQIGVSASSVRNDRVLGAQVRNIVAGSPAASAGLREGDVVTEFDGRPIDGADELTVAARTAPVGRAVPFSYWRDGRTFTGTITPAAD